MSRGQTVLMTAARTGNVDVVRALLEKGADVNAREKQLGETALMWAASENHAAVVKVLVGAAPKWTRGRRRMKFPKDRFGLEGVLTILPRGNWTPLMYAARDGAPDATRAARGRRRNQRGRSRRHDAARARDLELALRHGQGAARRGADPNLPDTAEMGALYAAVDNSSLGEIYGSRRAR